MPDADADWLGIPRGGQTLERQAFLRVGGADTAGRVEAQGRSGPGEQIALFAVSLFPRSSLPAELCEEIMRGHLPVGKLIRDRPTHRDRLEVAYRPVLPLAEALGFPPTLRFWTRRYRLTIAACGPGMIFEAFAPRAMLR